MLVSISSTTVKALVPKFKRTVNDLRNGTYNPKSSQVLFNKNLCHYACAEFVARLPESKRKDYFWILLGKGEFITHSVIADNKGIVVDTIGNGAGFVGNQYITKRPLQLKLGIKASYSVDNI